MRWRFNSTLDSKSRNRGLVPPLIDYIHQARAPIAKYGTSLPRRTRGRPTFAFVPDGAA